MRFGDSKFEDSPGGRAGRISENPSQSISCHPSCVGGVTRRISVQVNQGKIARTYLKKD
jgi:hypothetical protein